MVEQQSDATWHAMPDDEVLRRLTASKEGLGTAVAKERLSQVGANALEAGEGVHPAVLLIRQVHNPLIYLLIGAAVVSLLGGHYADAGVIAGVVVLNSALGFFQEWRAEGALAALRKMSAPQAKVLRDGQARRIEATDVVPGDVLVLETGDRVAADALVLSGEDLHVDESALTGESQAVAKAPGHVEESSPVADRHNMIWMSTGVTGGRRRDRHADPDRQDRASGEKHGAGRDAPAETDVEAWDHPGSGRRRHGFDCVRSWRAPRI